MRKVLSLNANWRFFRGDVENACNTHLNDKNWEIVNLPHTGRLESADCSGQKNYLGVLWYRKLFYLPDEYKNKKIYISFGGAKHIAKIFVNGIELYTHFGGYLPFTVDITQHILFNNQLNLISVMLDNSDMPDVPPGKPQFDLDFCYHSGLYRNVKLVITENLHITDAIYANKTAGGGIFVTYSSVSEKEASIYIKTNIINENTIETSFFVQHKLIDQNNNLIKEYRSDKYFIKSNSDLDHICEMEILNPMLWSPNKPNLYTLVTSIEFDDIIIDQVETNIGIRKIEFNSKGFFINGEHVHINGANRHQEYVYIGDALPDSLHERDAILLKQTGFNFVRTGHYPQADAFFDACDKLGLMCVVPTPGWQWFLDNDVFKNRSYQNVRDIIRHLRNHPCIILWEPILNEVHYSYDYAKTTYQIAHEEYPSDQCYAACDHYMNAAELYDVVYGEYDDTNKTTRPLLIREYGDNYVEGYGRMHTLRRVSRGIHGFYEGGAEAMTQSALERLIEFNKTFYYEPLCGAALWTGIDHNRAYMDNIAATGVLDLYRLPKFSRYMYQSQKNLNDTPIVFFCSDWDKAPIDNRLVVFTNCDEVELYINNNYIDTCKPDQKYLKDKERIRRNSFDPDKVSFDHLDFSRKGVEHPPIFFDNIHFEKGEIKAIGYKDGEKVTEHIVKSPNKAVKLLIEYDDLGVDFKADGSDLLMVYVSALDNNNVVDVHCYDKVTCFIEGEGTIIGDKNDRVKSNPINLEAGKIGFLLQSTHRAGNIKVWAESNDLKSNQLMIQTIKSPLEYPNEPELLKPIKVPEYDADKKETPIAFHIQRVNAALNKKVTATSEDGKNKAQNILDGKLTTYWKAENKQPQSLNIDLGKVSEITGFKINWKIDNTYYTYNIEVSKDKKNWEKVVSNTATGHYNRLDNLANHKKIRYIRVNITDVSTGVAEIISFAALHKVIS